MVPAQVDASDARGLFKRLEQMFCKKKSQAEAGKNIVLHSPSFYTARHGYRLICSLCPHGDGKGENLRKLERHSNEHFFTVRGQYMSAFVAVVKGEYDALLQWPFSYKVCTNNHTTTPRSVYSQFLPIATYVNTRKQLSNARTSSSGRKFACEKRS